MRQAFRLVKKWQQQFETLDDNAVEHFVPKLVKSFGRLGDAAESLDDFRYARAGFWLRKMLHSVALTCSATKVERSLRLWPCQKVSNRKDVHIEVTNSKVWEGNN